MTFKEVLAQVIDWLQENKRISYRALQRQFELDDDYLEDLKEELLYAHPVIDDGRGLIWTGDPEATPPPSEFSRRQPVQPVIEPVREPLTYTPRHLAEKILTSRSALEGERKQVTVLFCDIANSTPLAARLGPEKMHQLLNRFFEIALEEIHHYEGTINQFLGDGFMALFGAPIAHEDHARRAVQAAVGLHRRLHEGSHAPGQPYGVAVTTRMGLHSGVVIVGAIGDNLRMDYTAVGDTTNVASRLQHAAEAGQIVISDATHRLVEGYCTVQTLGELSLKGKAEPMPAWEVLAARESRTRLEVEAEHGLTPYVGRERERQLVSDCFRQVRSGQGQVVFVVGEAGIGKSRFLLEVRRQLGSEAAWLEGHALSFGRTMAFHPLIDLLKRRFQIEENDTEGTIIGKIAQGVLPLGEEFRPLLPYLRYLLAVDPGDPAVQTMDPQLRRAELFDALRRLLLKSAEVMPQVLVFEDLYWMDQASEAFLTFIADSLPRSRILCLFTYRPGYMHPFGERTYHTRIALPVLSTSDTGEMARGMLSTEQLPAALTELIVQKSEGNPFYVEEVVKSLQEVGAIERVGDHYSLTCPLDEIEVPDTIQDVIMARIDRLPEAPKKTLQLASVIGREFTRRLLERLADLKGSADSYLQALKAIELIYETQLYPELAYMFKHALTQGDLPLAQEFLDGVYRLTHDPTTSDWMKWRYSMHLFASLGEFWLARGDPARAQAFTDQALDIATRTHSRKYMVKGWRLKGEIAFAHRQWDEAERWMQQALTLAQSVGNPTQLWNTHLALGRLHSELRRPIQARQAYGAVRAVLDKIKVSLHNPELRAGFEQSPMIQQVYDLNASM